MPGHKMWIFIGQLDQMCQHVIFMVFSKLLFPSFNLPYVQILALTILRFTNHTTQEQQDDSFHCKSEYRLATAMSTQTLPHRINPRSLPPQEKYPQPCPKPRGVPPLHPVILLCTVGPPKAGLVHARERGGLQLC